MSLINQQNQLTEICKLIADKKITAIDTEFIRENTYNSILCLIQINVAGNYYLVDTLSGIDLTEFLQVLNDEKIIKIFHSSRQDLEVLYENFSTKIFPKSIFDTQIMSAMCGLGFTVSYSSLAKTLLDKDIAKDWQRSDWQARPLLAGQIEYAIADVAHLPEIYKILLAQLEQGGKLSWAKEEMDSNIKKALTKDDLYRKFSFFNKSKTYIENIKLLADWRDDKAKKLNIPRSFVLKDDLVDKIAFYDPSDVEKLERCGFKTRILDDNLKLEIVELLKNKPVIDEDYQRISMRVSEEQKNLYQKTKILLQEKAKQYQISPELIINQNNLSHLVYGYKTIADILPSWRYEVFGRDLENLIIQENNDKK